MNNSPACTVLVKHLVGPLSRKKRSLVKGFALGVLIFGIFEGLSLVNPNLPRIPAPWFIAVTIWCAQIALFIKIARFLRHPRTEDFFFIVALSSVQRNDIAQKAIASVYNAVFPFVLSSLSIIVPLEFFIFREHSILNLIIVPAAVIAVVWLVFMAGMGVFKRGLIRPTAKDELSSGLSFLAKGILANFFSTLVMKISKTAGACSPVKIRPFVIRNVMYLLRSDPLQLPLITCTAPVLLCLFMMLIGDSGSLFMEFLTILSIFLLNFYFSAHLQDAIVKLKECPYYEYRPNRILTAHLFTAAIFSVPYLLIFLGALNVHLLSVNGALRLLNFLTALIATLFVNCRAVLHPQRKDSESMTDFTLFFFTIAPGLFIPAFGWFFPFLGIIATLLLEWETVFDRGTAENGNSMREKSL